MSMKTIESTDLATLQRAGLIPAGRYLDASNHVRDHTFWARWAGRALLALGVAHVLAGVLFFFAYNWADMPAMAKFAVVQAGILGCLVGAWLAGVDRPVGQSLLIGASVLTGVLLAVIGQVYQTGADAYELFAAWTVLILPWALASRSAAHWLVWLVVACLAAGLYAGQVLVPTGFLLDEEVVLPPAVVLVVALAARELAVARGAVWLSPHWTRQIVLFAMLASLYVTAFGHVFDWHDSVPGTALFALALLVGAVAYARAMPNFAAITQVVGFAGLYAMALGTKLIDAVIDIDFNDLWRSLFGIGVVVAWLVAITGSMGVALPAIRRRLAEGQQ